MQIGIAIERYFKYITTYRNLSIIFKTNLKIKNHNQQRDLQITWDQYITTAVMIFFIVMVLY